MIHFAKWKIVLILIVCALGLIYAAPNLLLDREASEIWAEEAPAWLPGRQVNLGLDLQGGSHLLLRVDWESIVRERLESVVDSLRTSLRGADIGYP